MSGEREIRDTADALNKLNLRHTEVLPLYARLSNSEQNRVFQAHSGRRIVLATNVAETSLTVPGIKYVTIQAPRVSAATASGPKYSACRLSRFPRRRPNQRKGRCGRVSEGSVFVFILKTTSCRVREFTDPEILRTNLASVILQMTALGLGDIAAFPFVEAPDKRNIQDGVRLLEELGAITTDEQQTAYKLTPMGRQLEPATGGPASGAHGAGSAKNTAACARR